MKKENLLTGDRPTGKLHIGHYIGSLKKRVEIQDQFNNFIMIADQQALTDNAKNPKKIQNSLIEVILDYLSVGIDPIKSNIFVQSQIPELSELTMHYLNLVSISRLKRNPTFKASIVPVGEDQIPMIEQTNEIVKTFNNTYKQNVLNKSKALLPEKGMGRLPGIDGKAKMSKSLNNAIYLSDSPDIIRQKVMSMYTDPNHIRVTDPGRIEDNTVFTYLDVFCKDKKYLAEMKEHYKAGGLGDVKVKKYLNEIIQAELEPIRNRRNQYQNNLDYIYEILKDGSNQARLIASQTLHEVRDAMGINYF